MRTPKVKPNPKLSSADLTNLVDQVVASLRPYIDGLVKEEVENRFHARAVDLMIGMAGEELRRRIRHEIGNRVELELKVK